MSSIPLTPQQRAQRWGTVAKWGACLLAGLLFAPIAIATIQGMIGLIVAGVICIGTWALIPAIASGATNLRLKLIKAEAAKNPIETLESEYLRRQLILGERKQAIETFNSKTRTFGDKLDGFKRQYPSEAPKFQSTYDQMITLLRRQQAQWKEADKGLDLFAGEIRKAKAMWAMALAAADAREGSGLDEDSFYAQLKVETSLDAIQDGMNLAFSQLDSLLMEGDSDAEVNVTPAPAALPAPSSIAIDVAALNPAKAKAAR